jgi:HPt (histidine-containing phosphotransfer) domain-containing protein
MNSKSTPPIDREELKRRLGVMHEKYRANAPAKIQEIEALWARVLDAPPGDAGRAELVLAAHTLVGSAPTLGCEALGAAAGRLEQALRAAFEREQPLTDDERTSIGRLIGGLAEALI